MAGQPRARAVYRELERRAIAEVGPGAGTIDYVEHWVANGGTLVDLAADLQRQLGHGVSREMVRRAAYEIVGSAAGEQRLRRAREAGASAMIETGLREAQEVAADRDQIAKQKLVNDFRAFLAGAWNREDFGRTNAPTVQVNVQTLHLDALRVRQVIANPLPSIAENVQVIAADEVVQLLPPGPDPVDAPLDAPSVTLTD